MRFQSSIARGQHFLCSPSRTSPPAPDISVLYRSRTAFLGSVAPQRQTHSGYFSPLSLEDSISWDSNLGGTALSRSFQSSIARGQHFLTASNSMRRVPTIFQSSIARGQHFLLAASSVKPASSSNFSPLSLEDSISWRFTPSSTSCAQISVLYRSRTAFLGYKLVGDSQAYAFQSSIARGQHFLGGAGDHSPACPVISVLYRSRTAFLGGQHRRPQRGHLLFQSSIARGQHFLVLRASRASP